MNSPKKNSVWKAAVILMILLIVTEMIMIALEKSGVIRQPAAESTESAENENSRTGTTGEAVGVQNQVEKEIGAVDQEGTVEGKDAAEEEDSTNQGKDQEGFSGLYSGLSHDGYTLEKVVVLSRHNIRSPLSGNGSVLDTLTPYSWHEWSSNPSELSLRGGVLETEMGEYFRKWLEAEGLFPENYHPEDGEVRIYANSKQRTTATANYFTTGLLPTSNIQTETHMEFDEMDPVFTPQLLFVNDEYVEDVREQVDSLFSEKIDDLVDNYDLLKEVLDFEDSEAFKNGDVADFVTDDTELILEANAEPGMKGSLKTGCSASDALILQYYETADTTEAAFGEELTHEQWEDIAEIKEVYGDVLFTAPLVCPQTAHPLLEEIRNELDESGRRFTFLCGHDSNIGSVLAALETEEYELPGGIEKKTPIGSKLVFSVWKDAEGASWMSLDLVYQTDEQLRSVSLLDLGNPPAVFPVSLQGLEKNADGLYDTESMMERIEDAIREYDQILDEYDLADAA